MNLFSLSSPLLSLAKHPCSEAERTRQGQGDVGAVVYPCKALHSSYGVLREAQSGAHPLTTIDPTLRPEGTSLRNISQRSRGMHCGCSSAGDRLLVVFGSAEALLPVAGATCTLRSTQKPPAGFKPAGG